MTFNAILERHGRSDEQRKEEMDYVVNRVKQMPGEFLGSVGRLGDGGLFEQESDTIDQFVINTWNNLDPKVKENIQKSAGKFAHAWEGAGKLDATGYNPFDYIGDVGAYGTVKTLNALGKWWEWGHGVRSGILQLAGVDKGAADKIALGRQLFTGRAFPKVPRNIPGFSTRTLPGNPQLPSGTKALSPVPGSNAINVTPNAFTQTIDTILGVPRFRGASILNQKLLGEQMFNISPEIQRSLFGIVQTPKGPVQQFMSTTGGDQPNEFQQLVLNFEQKDSAIKIEDLPSNMPTPFISKELNEELGLDGKRLEGYTYQEIQSLGPSVLKSYHLKRPYKDAATIEGYARMTTEVEKSFINLLGDDFDRDLVRQYMLDVSKHETALKELQKLFNDKTGKLWDVSHATALRNLEHSGRMLGNKGLFSAFNYPDVLDQTPLGKPIVNIEREGNRPDPTARGANFQRTLSRVLGKPLSLHESVLYWYDQDMFYFYKELSPLQRQQIVDSSRTRSGGRIKSELTVAENINQALESMKFGKETMSGKLGRPLTDEERLKALVDLATSELLKKRKYKRTDFKTIPRQGNVFYDIDTGEATDYSPDPGIGSSWDVEDPDPDNKYSK